MLLDVRIEPATVPIPGRCGSDRATMPGYIFVQLQLKVTIIKNFVVIKCDAIKKVFCTHYITSLWWASSVKCHAHLSFTFLVSFRVLSSPCIKTASMHLVKQTSCSEWHHSSISQNIWACQCEKGTSHIDQQRRFMQACSSVQSRQSLGYSLTQYEKYISIITITITKISKTQI